MNEAVIFIIASTLFFPPVPVVTGRKGVPEEEGELYKWLVRGGSLVLTRATSTRVANAVPPAGREARRLAYVGHALK